MITLSHFRIRIPSSISTKLMILGGFGATFAAITLGSHVLGPEDYILLSLILTFSSYVFIFASGGISNSLFRMSPAIHDGRLVIPPSVDLIFLAAGIATLMIGIPIVGLATDPPQAYLFAAIGIVLASLTVIARAVAFLNAAGNTFGAAFAQNAWRVGVVVIGAILFLAGVRWNSGTVLLCFVLALSPLCLWSLIRSSPIYCTSVVFDLRDYLATAVVVSLSGISFLLIVTIDRWFVAKTMLPEQAAHYLFHVSLVAGPMALVQSAVGFGLVPRIMAIQGSANAIAALIKTEILSNAILAFGVIIALTTVYFIGSGILYRSAFYDPPFFAMVLVTNLFRLATPIPSAIVGGLASSSQLNRINVISWSLLGALAAAILALHPESPYVLAALVGIAGTFRLSVWIWYARILLTIPPVETE